MYGITITAPQPASVTQSQQQLWRDWQDYTLLCQQLNLLPIGPLASRHFYRTKEWLAVVNQRQQIEL